jgi:hypothetical protein
MKKVSIILISLFTILSLSIKAQDVVGVTIHFTIENCKNKIFSNLSNLSLGVEGIKTFEKGTTGIGLFLESEDVYIINFLAGKTFKKIIFDTRGVVRNMEVMFDVNFNEHNTTQTIFYDIENNSFTWK